MPYILLCACATSVPFPHHSLQMLRARKTYVGTGIIRVVLTSERIRRNKIYNFLSTLVSKEDFFPQRDTSVIEGMQQINIPNCSRNNTLWNTYNRSPKINPVKEQTHYLPQRRKGTINIHVSLVPSFHSPPRNKSTEAVRRYI